MEHNNNDNAIKEVLYNNISLVNNHKTFIMTIKLTFK